MNTLKIVEIRTVKNAFNLYRKFKQKLRNIVHKVEVSSKEMINSQSLPWEVETRV